MATEGQGEFDGAAVSFANRVFSIATIQKTRRKTPALNSPFSAHYPDERLALGMHLLLIGERP
jgi:hypothetical protein